MWALCLDARMLILTKQPILSLLLRSDCFDMPFSGLPLPSIENGKDSIWLARMTRLCRLVDVLWSRLD
jgi:hypothetical protein